MNIQGEHSHCYLDDDHIIEQNQKKTKWVVLITLVMMVGEIATGYFSGSMALTAEGWHMASHAGAFLLALLAYKMAKSKKMNQKFSFGAGKLIPLGGYTNAILLTVVAIFIAVESIQRVLSPVAIEYNIAIGIALLGLSVNIVSALILNDNSHSHDHHHGGGHHHHKHVHDHNIRSAFLHVIADAVTSVLVIVALSLGKFFNFVWLDPIVGIIGSIVILSWSVQLLRDTGWELLDGHSKAVDWKKIKATIEIEGAKILDFHIWRIAPKTIACELVVSSHQPKGIQYYKDMLHDDFNIQHIIVEERSV